MIKTCVVCGKEFKTIPHGTRKKYCSNECFLKIYREKRTLYSRARDRHRRPREIICKNCGRPFMGMYTQKYCMPCLESATSGPLKKYYGNRK